MAAYHHKRRSNLPSTAREPAPPEPPRRPRPVMSAAQIAAYDVEQEVARRVETMLRALQTTRSDRHGLGSRSELCMEAAAILAAWAIFWASYEPRDEEQEAAFATARRVAMRIMEDANGVS